MALMRKMKLVWLSFKLCKWRFPTGIRLVAGTRRSRSFNVGRRRGLCGCFEDDVETSSTITRLQRTRSCSYTYSKYDDRIDDDDDDDDDDNDVDRRAEIFISNFRSRLLMEREVSLKLRYREKD